MERVPCRGSSPSSVSFRVPVATEDASLLPTVTVQPSGPAASYERSRQINAYGGPGRGSKVDVIAVGADNQLISEFVKQASAIPIVAMIPSVAAGFVRNIATPKATSPALPWTPGSRCKENSSIFCGKLSRP